VSFSLSVERPDLTLTAAAVSNHQGIINLFGSPPAADYFVTAWKLGYPTYPGEAALLAGNQDIVSFPVAATATVPVYNLPELSASVPLLLNRQVKRRAAQLVQVTPI
jgi:hypothetical protein